MPRKEIDDLKGKLDRWDDLLREIERDPTLENVNAMVSLMTGLMREMQKLIAYTMESTRKEPPPRRARPDLRRR